MGKKLHQKLSSYCYGGISKELFKQHKSTMMDKNLITVKRLCYIGAATSLPLCVISFAVPSLENASGMYFLTFLFSCIGIVLNRQLLANNKNLILGVYYFVTGVELVICTVLGTVLASGNSAALVLIMMNVLPLFIIDKPIHVSILNTCITTLFCILSLLYKSPEISSIDCANAICFLIINCVVIYFFMHAQLNDIVLKTKLEVQRDTDTLTHLYNRGAAETYITEQLFASTEAAAMILIDLDYFKNINDTFGHIAGDKLLIETAEILRKHFAEYGFIARIGGDEFMIFVESVQSIDILEEKVRQIVIALDRSVSNDKYTQKVSASVGVAHTSTSATSYDDMYKIADKAMYEVKFKGKNGYAVWHME